MNTAAIGESNMPFLNKIMRQANLPDIYDARDITIVVFRTMRDLMTTEAADGVAEDLNKEDIVTLWKDTNPIVAFLSRIRQPLEIDSELFIRRVFQEGGVPKGVTAEAVIEAVFSATKEELSEDKVKEIATYLPPQIQAMWEKA